MFVLTNPNDTSRKYAGWLQARKERDVHVTIERSGFIDEIE